MTEGISDKENSLAELLIICLMESLGRSYTSFSVVFLVNIK
jgi:hypothetical protein